MEITIEIEKKILDIIAKFYEQTEDNTLDLASPAAAARGAVAAPRRTSAIPSLPSPSLPSPATGGSSTGGGGGY